MKDQKKILGEERRTLILHLLKESDKPLTGSDLAEQTNVSRQIIVGDISLLRAKNEPIIATSQGYLYIKNQQSPTLYERTIASIHSPERTEEELKILVDYGVTVKDVKIVHKVYGDLTASIMVSNRKEVENFVKKIMDVKAAYLSELTEGIHLHTICASTEKALLDAEEALRKANFLVDSTE